MFLSSRSAPGVSLALAVAAVGSKIDGDRGVVLAAPGQVEGNEIVGARVEQHVNATGTQRVEVTGDEHTVRNGGGEPLQVLPGVPRSNGLTVEDRAEVPAEESMVQRTGDGLKLVPRFAVTQSERGVPDRRHTGMNSGHPLVVDDGK